MKLNKSEVTARGNRPRLFSKMNFERVTEQMEAMRKRVKELEEKRSLELALAQFTGFAEGRYNQNIISLVDSMGLTEKEWGKLKREPTGLNKREIEEIDSYFNGGE